MRKKIVFGVACLIVARACVACSSTETAAPAEPQDAPEPVIVALSSVHLGAENCTQGPCDFSKVQLSFTANAHNSGLTSIQITGVTLFDAVTGAKLQSLTASTPLSVTGSQSNPWDETIAPAANIQASFTLSPPTWSTIDPSNQYARQYKVQIEVLIIGVTIDLESPALSRDAPATGSP